MSVRPFRVLGVQQFAIGGRDRQVVRELWVDCLGLSPVGTFQSAAENVDEEILSVGVGIGRIEVDLMQPIDENARPVTHTPPLHHVGLWIDSLRSAAAWLVFRGVRLTQGGIRSGAGGHDVCFIHPKPSRWFPVCGNGVLIELVQAPAFVIAEYRAVQGQRSGAAGGAVSPAAAAPLGSLQSLHQALDGLGSQ
jgi:lactoylglutathione lyase